jgi:hypothetical protein
MLNPPVSTFIFFRYNFTIYFLKVALYPIEDIMAQQDLLLNALNKANRALAILEEQMAGYGSLAAPANLIIELEDKRNEVLNIQNRLAELDKPVVSTPALNPSLAIDAQTAELLEPEYPALLDALLDGKLVFFLGNEISPHNPVDSSASSEKELALLLAKKFRFTLEGEPDLVRVAQRVSVLNGSGPLYDTLRPMLSTEQSPIYLHHFLANLPTTLKAKGCNTPYQLIVTNNFDNLLEKAFQEAGEPYDLVAYIAEGEHRNKFWHWPPGDKQGRLVGNANLDIKLSPEERTIILKIHGAAFGADPKSTRYAITEDHYIDYISRTGILELVPVTILEKLHTSQLLFLGYSLEDWNQRAMLYRLWGEQRFNYLPSWAVQTSVSPMDKKLWERRDATPLTVRLDWFIQGLNDLVQNLPGGKV